MLWLIQIAAGHEPDALARGTPVSGASSERLRAAAGLYLQHVVFAPNADHYRALAVEQGAPQATLREQVAWLMKWLHPDRAASDWEAVFAQRVLAAWNELKTPEKRAAYDATLPPRPHAMLTRSGRRRALTRAPRAAPLIKRRRPLQRRTKVRVASYVLAGALAAAVIFAAGWGKSPAQVHDDQPTLADSGG